jgi:hypothetical protein
MRSPAPVHFNPQRRFKKMAEFLLSKEDMLKGLRELGELARKNNLDIKLALVGGAVMVLEYQTRELTHDIDAVVLSPTEKWKVFELVRIIASKYGWPEDWLNDNVEIYIGDDIISHRLFLEPGIEVFVPVTEQMLALKLSAARGGVDLNDAAELLKNMSGSRDEIWQKIVPYILQGSMATAEDAYDMVWSDVHGYEEDERYN